MPSDPKQHFVAELRRHYEQIISGAYRAESAAAQGAETLQSESRTREDARAAASEARLAGGLRARRQQAKAELEQLLAFTRAGIPRFGPRSAVDLGALVDVEVEGEHGAEGRTLFMLPVGAGTELTGPGGDGFISVVTPASPVGSALRGARIGDPVEVAIGGDYKEWVVLDVM